MKPHEPTKSRPYIVVTAAAQMPSSCWGVYRRVAVLECDPGPVPKMISPRARGVRRVVRTWEKQSVGSTGRSAYAQAVAQAEALAKHLNRMHSKRPISVREILAERNEAYRRELIERYGGLDRFLASTKAETVGHDPDNAATLVRLPTAGEPIVALSLTCPSTGKHYWLRVPPQIQTPRDGLAWSFEMRTADYRPDRQS